MNEQFKIQKKSSVFLPLIFALILIIGIALGYVLSMQNLNGQTQTQSAKGNSKINSLLEYIKYQYVDTINENRLVEKTVTSMLESLDPHSSYIPASEFDVTNESLEGNFDGIGIEFNIIRDTIRVINPIEGGPSNKIGIKAGDKIIKVENSVVAGINITNKQVFDKLRGKSGTAVNVMVLRNGLKQLLPFKIIRDAIPLYSIDASYIIKPTIGYIKISKFAATTYNEYIKAFNQLSKLGMKKLILDLRGNPGGYLNAAIDISDEFLKGGLQIVYTEGKSNPKKMYKATEHGSFENNDLVILIDEGSASASEIVAGAMQDNDRATIIGRRSYGKGLVQDQLQLPDGSAIRLTIARYYTPTGRCIQKPYSEDKEKYYSEEYDRFDSGELFNSDSIKLDKTKKYMTPEGKIVYGGGGIMPDVFVPIDTAKANTFLNRVFYSGVINSFAFEYADNNRSEILKYKTSANFILKFEITNTILEQFYVYCTNQKLKLGVINKEKSNAALKPYLKAFIGRDVFGKDAYYPIINQNDKCIIKATEILSE